ncbi:Glutathione S-transferase U18 [Linum perenne]
MIEPREGGSEQSLAAMSERHSKFVRSQRRSPAKPLEKTKDPSAPFWKSNSAPRASELLKSNPVHKKIPLLIHNDRPICESNIIVEYIDEAWSSGPSLLPSDAYAIARFWASYLDEKWFPTLRTAASAPNEEAKTAAVNQLKEGLTLLEEAYGKISKGKAFFGGETIGYLDIAFGSLLGWLKAVQVMIGTKLIAEDSTPGLAKWVEKFSADPAVKDVMPETEKLNEFAKVLAAKAKGASAS